MGIVNKISNFFKKKEKKVSIEDRVEKYKKLVESYKKSKLKKKKPHKSYLIGDITYKLGDKVIGRSNDCDPLLVGNIVEFWDNNNRWSRCIPQIKDDNNKIWGFNGIIRPHSKKLVDTLSKMKPLEQWNYFVPSEFKYSKEDIVIKQKRYDKKKFFKKK